MRRKMARPDLDHRSELPEVLVAVRTSLPFCRKAGKTPTFMPVRKSSGESRIMMRAYPPRDCAASACALRRHVLYRAVAEVPGRRANSRN